MSLNAGMELDWSLHGGRRACACSACGAFLIVQAGRVSEQRRLHIMPYHALLAAPRRSLFGASTRSCRRWESVRDVAGYGSDCSVKRVATSSISCIATGM